MCLAEEVERSGAFENVLRRHSPARPKSRPTSTDRLQMRATTAAAVAGASQPENGRLSPPADHGAAADQLARRDDSTQRQSRLRRSWHAMGDLFTPFSSSALASLPQGKPGNGNAEGDNGVVVRDYQSTGNNARATPPAPKKPTERINVEPKVWLANERTWVAYLNVGVLLGTMALILFNAASDAVTRYMAYAYAAISIGVLAYGYAVYQHRITMIRRKDPGHFDQIVGPVIICALLFIAVLANFLIRLRESRAKEPRP